MREIYFIRHGEGYHNLFNFELNNYHLQFPRLTVVGLKQCFSLRDELKNIKFDSSDLLDKLCVTQIKQIINDTKYMFIDII